VPTASLPELEKRTISMPGTASTTLAAASISSSYGSPGQVPNSVIALVTASVTARCRCPRIIGPRPSR
jgi:hypothetical protein